MDYFYLLPSAQEITDIACGATTKPAYVYNDTNIIESPNYPDNHPGGSYCEWVITPLTSVNVSTLGISGCYCRIQ